MAAKAKKPTNANVLAKRFFDGNTIRMTQTKEIV